MSRDDYQAREAQRRADEASREAANKMWQKRSDDSSNRQADERRKTNEAWQRSGGCFPKGTKITTPSGLCDISELREGDFVVSMNCKTGEQENCKILKKLTHTKRKIWQIGFSDGSSILTTSVHSFSIGEKWKKASEIRSGDVITSFEAKNGFNGKTVQSSNETDKGEDVYNLVIEDNFNFVADGIVAHSFTYLKVVKAWAWTLRQAFGLMPFKIKNVLKLAEKA